VIALLAVVDIIAGLVMAWALVSLLRNWSRVALKLDEWGW
jgi:hypothetical protein